ncbi:DUF5689 domain-containing protein [uncultured Flavobacterium sp.]|uniref:DUF5689 domain-containing protein n=1 Tax=uncultured Flavobacterium sp. TaxID=165435 RepID=UPI0030EE5549|tara:strand:- start:116278 stop:117636 length:1359 start_codon:yes stop_codon:yes gene_type:complete
MKKTKNLLLISLLAIFTGCVNSDEYNTPDLSSECVNLTATKTVAEITNAATSTATKYENDDIIEAYVTSSDEGGNFYKSISFQSVDGTKGFSMPVDTYNLFNQYEPGRLVYIKMKDRYVATSQSSTIIGNLYNGNVGRISGVEYNDVLKRGCTKVNENDIIKNLTVSNAKNNQYLNMLIEFNNVQFTDASLGKTFFDTTLNSFGGATNHLITDEFGQTIIVRVSEFANFASNSIPSGSGKIRGVLTKYNNDYQFMVRTINDVNLPNDRLDLDFFPPIVGTNIVYNSTLNEPFTTYTVNQQSFPKYINDAAQGSRYWQAKSFGGNSYIQMSSFGGGNTEINKSLFIVPVDMTAANTLSFKTNDGYNNGAAFKVFYTTNYVPGSQITTATLVDITSSFTISSGNTSGYGSAFTNSGVYNIPAAITGNGFFVFQYLGSGASGPTTTMQLDDIVIN